MSSNMNSPVLRSEIFLVIAGYAGSLLGFRLPLITELKLRGFELHVAAPGLANDKKTKQQLEAHGFIAHDIPMRRAGVNPFADLRTLFAMYSLIRRLRPDWMLAYTIKPVIYGVLASAFAMIPRRFALITGLGYAFSDEKERRKLGALVERLYAFSLDRAHKVFFQNPDDESLFRQKGILKKTALSCVVNGSGVDLDKFSIAPVPEGSIRFLLIARLLGDKGVREYVEAARRVKLQYPSSEFCLVGRIDANPNAIETGELNGWVQEGFVKYLGELPDVRPAIAASSVYVLPSYREGTPRTVLEAMAMGRPIITTDAPGCRETVIDGDNGFLVKIKSARDIEHAMIKFIQMPAIIEQMGRRSREIAEDKYDVKKVNSVMLREMGIR